jgi:hypothetical protein
MTTFLAYLTVYGLPVLFIIAALYGLYRLLWWLTRSVEDDAPAPLKSVEAQTPEDELANIIYVSYIRYVQDMFWNKKQFEWDFRKMAEWLKPQTQSRYADTMILRVLSECRDIDKVRQDKTNDMIRQFPQRYRNRSLQPPWVTISKGDVRLAIETVLNPHTVTKLLAMKNTLDIPPPAFQTY